MPFFLDGNPTPAEISEAVNYVLANLNDTVVANQGTGQIVGPSGEVTGYLYKYISIRYADSFDGTLNFSNTPTNRLYYGIRNSDSSVESTNPADYVWNNVTGGFGTTKFLWYLIPGGRQISFQVSVTKPNPGWEQDAGVSIDLDYTTTSVGSPANFVVIRVANDSSAPTNAEVLAAIGRDPIDGDLCTVNYNSGISSIVYKYTTGWAVFQRYITGDLIVANSIVGNNIAANTITGNNIAANTITSNNIAANTITSNNIAANTITGNNIAANTITGNKIVANTITGNEIAANTITASNIAASTITATQIATGTISANNMAANSITAANGAIANAAITSAKIGDLQVNTLQIANNAVSYSAGANSSGSGANVTVNMNTGDRVFISSYVGASPNLVNTNNLTTVTLTANGATLQTVSSRPFGGSFGDLYYPVIPISTEFTATANGNVTFTINYNQDPSRSTSIFLIGLKK